MGLHELEDLVTESICDCLNIQKLSLGRFRYRSSSDVSQLQITSYWIAIIPKNFNVGLEFFARVNLSDKSSTIVWGVSSNVTKFYQRLRRDTNLDLFVLRPDFSHDTLGPPTLRSDPGPEHCRIIVRAWGWLVQADLIGYDCFLECGILDAIDDFKREFETQPNQG